ncbi:MULTISPECIES: glycoside hydrolase family 30 protein [Paenibacillus]|uniref:Glucosylceramidase n=1 Tax=Paenibacillus odorifer TaxID=189426 RepID=A0A1R0X2J0_9BACL|nr:MULTISPECIES: glycoside hydrolase family 30 protein [Paenibacillus]ETT45079.1 glucosylceramidase [Paenibacillus sp. FSL H8-237]OMD27257.1 glucosylceramidase [Paenibacillus odorifer]OME29909.1 glucosylceramidase [Paenibacillus odorifer]OME33777.1 glucosylceramidase [Paenibacillus odorifer]OME50846.1 glucosylceramidase [Paenibacillus odorifer]
MSKTIRVIQTAKETTDRLTEKDPLIFLPDTSGVESELINIYDDLEYQEIEGFGGALTESSAVTIAKLSAAKQKEIIDAYFHPEHGIGYTLCRSHIQSCDFSLGNYAYVEEGDAELRSFDISRDHESVIPLIKNAAAAVGEDFRLFSSPWSPPAFMKTNGQMNGGGALKPEYRKAWANMFVKYIEAYTAEGIDIWAVSVQNEAKAVQRWDSCLYTAEEEKDFVRDYLGPALEQAGLGHVKVMIWDHNKERVYDRAKVAFEDQAASKYIWGICFHWYSGDHFEALSAVHDRFPDKKLFFSEGCQEGGVHLGSWNTGERYGHDIIGNLNNWMSSWTDWNIVLDEQGGPNHVGNYCDAPIIGDTKNDEITFESSFYYIGHFSKYIRPGAKRIGFSKYTDKLETTAFRNPDSTIAVIVMNRTEQELPFTLRFHDELAENMIPAHAIQTLLIK